MTTTIERIALAATGQPPQQSGEDRQSYLVRITKALDAATQHNKEWRALPDAAKSWLIASRCELANHRPAPEFDADTEELRQRALEYGAARADEYLKSLPPDARPQ